jgi:hypothetical protein
MNPIEKAKNVLLVGGRKTFKRIPDFSLRIYFDAGPIWTIKHPYFTIHIDALGNGLLSLIKKKDILKEEKTVLPILKKIEDAFDSHIEVNPISIERNDAKSILYELHRNKLKNINIPKNLKSMVARDDVPEYWVRYHGGMYGKSDRFHRFKVPKDVVIQMYTYPGCPMFRQRIPNWESKGLVDCSYEGCSKRIFDNNVFSVSYIHSDIIPNILLTTADEDFSKMGLYRRRNGEESFIPVDLKTPQIWLGDLVYTRGPGVYYVPSCMSVTNANLKKLPLVENLKNLTIQAEKARKRKIKESNVYETMHSEISNILERHIQNLKSKAQNTASLGVSLFNAGTKLYLTRASRRTS